MKLPVLLALALAFCLASTPLRGEQRLDWSRPLPALPDEHGFAGMFAGVSGGSLIAAGGANFPDAPPWKNGTKVWHDSIYLLAADGAKWSAAGEKLPRPLAYGVSLTVRHDLIATSDHRGVVCLGGDDGKQARREVVLLTRHGDAVRTTSLPPLPRPCTQMCGAQVGDVLYIAGGAASLDATRSLRTFWSLDLALTLRAGDNNRRTTAWRELDGWPGSERMQAIAAGGDDAFYLIGGVRLTADEGGRPTRITPYLRDAYRYTPSKGEWSTLAELPRPVAASPSPAPVIDGSILVLGGVDGSLFLHDQATHPGFTRRTLRYEITADGWSEGDELPKDVARVTVPCVPWRDGYAIVSGESRPGVRSPAVNWVQPR